MVAGISMIQLAVLSRPNCHLCEEMKRLIKHVIRERQIPAQLEEIEISTRPDLERLYGMDVPVLLMDGRLVAKNRTTETKLVRMLGSGP